jgi:hypothetical protein
MSKYHGQVDVAHNVSRLIIGFADLPFDPPACLALHKNNERVTADDLRQVLILENPWPKGLWN